MIEHIVLFRFKPDADPVAIESLSEQIMTLPDRIGGCIADYQFGPNFSDRAAGFTHMLVSRFESREKLDEYLAHPDHVEVVSTYALPIADQVVVADLDRT